MNPEQMRQMMKQAQQMQERLQKQMAELRVEATAGGGMVTVSLVLAGGSGLAAVLQGKTEDREKRAIYAATALCVSTLAVAWLFSQFSPAWTTRYLGVALGPILLLAALGLARAGNLGLVALVIVLGVWAVPKTYDLRNKSNASDLRKAAAPQLRPGIVPRPVLDKAAIVLGALEAGPATLAQLVQSTGLARQDYFNWRGAMRKIEQEFRVVRAFTSKAGLREYVAVRGARR